MYIQGELFVYIYFCRQINMPTVTHCAKYMEDFFNVEQVRQIGDRHRSLCSKWRRPLYGAQSPFKAGLGGGGAG
jgi:hypothetical protein